ncbi:hypothetical protein [Zooshikella sp. RANM57]|uniref:hypothetical protein n=1 Tax=Zooshikella sp. RANM57 TaxID=3425863 RepID=UPI003D6E4259
MYNQNFNNHNPANQVNSNQQSAGPTHTVSVRIGTRKNDNQQRGIYRTIGSAFANQNGSFVLCIDVWPLGHTEFDGKLYVNPTQAQAVSVQGSFDVGSMGPGMVVAGNSQSQYNVRG